MILWVPPNSIYSLILRTSELRVFHYTSFSHFVVYCLVFFTSCGFIVLRSILLPEKGFTIF